MTLSENEFKICLENLFNNYILQKEKESKEGENVKTNNLNEESKNSEDKMEDQSNIDVTKERVSELTDNTTEVRRDDVGDTMEDIGEESGYATAHEISDKGNLEKVEKKGNKQTDKEEDDENILKDSEHLEIDDKNLSTNNILEVKDIKIEGNEVIHDIMKSESNSSSRQSQRISNKKKDISTDSLNLQVTNSENYDSKIPINSE